jgi:hypothetical protein
VDWWSQARLWSISGPFLSEFSTPFLEIFDSVFALVFGHLFLGMPFDVKRRAGLAKMGIGPLFEGSGNSGSKLPFSQCPPY